METVALLYVQGFGEFGRLLHPIPVDVDATVYFVDNRDTPPNITLERPDPSASNVILLDKGCDHPDWYLDPPIWRGVINHIFHETAHDATMKLFGDDFPEWIEEGAATYVAHRVSTFLDPERVQFPSALEQFVAMPEGQLALEFRPVKNETRRPSQGFRLIHRYERALGAYLAAERLSLDLFEQLIAYGADSELTDPSTLTRSFDELHSGAQALRSSLVSEAMAELQTSGNAREIALSKLAWLDECPIDVSAPSFVASQCEQQGDVPAIYVGTCLPRNDVEAAIRALMQCGQDLKFDAFLLVDAYARRFPQESPAILIELLEAEIPWLAAWSYTELKAVSGKSFKFDAYGSEKNKQKSIKRWRRWLESRAPASPSS